MNESVDHEIDITIEAVTGTVYDLCVSPFETILGIKTKIQRLEGNEMRHESAVLCVRVCDYIYLTWLAKKKKQKTNDYPRNTYNSTITNQLK